MYITHMTLKITARQLETAARRYLIKCAAAQLRGNIGGGGVCDRFVWEDVYFPSNY